MGNSESNAEVGGKYVGGWLGLVGGSIISVAFPPFAPAALAIGATTYTYGTTSMIRTFTESAKKEGTSKDFIGGMADTIFLGGNLKAGINYKDNDPTPNIHVCGKNINPIEMREQKETNEKINKVIQEENRKQDVEKFNNYMKEYIKLVNIYPKELKVDNINTKNFNSNKFTAFKFLPYSITPKNIFSNFESELKYYNDDPEIDRIYVIRRKLDTLPIYFGWSAHSGLLLKTKNGRWFICEYGCEKDKNKVSLYEVKDIKNNTDKFTTIDGRKWDKQICGNSLDKKVSITSVKKIMENKTIRNKYSILFWNCHMAQEMTREELGIKVDNKYLNEKYREEWNMMLFN